MRTSTLNLVYPAYPTPTPEHVTSDNQLAIVMGIALGSAMVGAIILCSIVCCCHYGRWDFWNGWDEPNKKEEPLGEPKWTVRRAVEEAEQEARDASAGIPSKYQRELSERMAREDAERKAREAEAAAKRAEEDRALEGGVVGGKVVDDGKKVYGEGAVEQEVRESGATARVSGPVRFSV